MAFDHPVEADRVDLSFGSVLARAPVIGSLMYLLGGRHAREEEDYATETRQQIDAALAMSSADTDNNLSESTSVDVPHGRRLRSALKKQSPSIAPTEDYSDSDSFQSAMDTEGEYYFRKKKELSWSDQSGQNLVEYMDALEMSTSKGSPLQQGCVHSHSLRKKLEDNETHRQGDAAKSYLPRMTPHTGGVVMPSMNNSARPVPNGGIESPQWGWYTNLTPPSPEMYNSRPYAGTGTGTTQNKTSILPTIPDRTQPKRPPSTKPNPIFQSLPSQRKDRVTHPTIPV